MKKLAVLGLLLAMSTGCGRGWFPHLFRGAPCNGLCSAPAPMMHDDCEGCAGTSAGYGSYEDQGTVVGGDYDGGTVIGSGTPDYGYQNIPAPGSIVNPNTPNLVPKQ